MRPTPVVRSGGWAVAAALGLIAAGSAVPAAAHPNGDVTDPDACPWPAVRRDYSIILLDPTGRLGGLRGCGRAVPAWSPFGIATTRDGHVIYEVELAIEGLDRPRGAGAEPVFVAWALSRDLSESHRIGVVKDGRVRGRVWFNQYVIAVTMEAAPDVAERTGPIVIRGRSPTGWLEPFHHHTLDGTGMPVRRP